MNKLIVHKEILKENVEKIQNSLKGKSIIYVAKANAYGLGIKAVLPTVLKFTNNIAVANFEEAYEIATKFQNVEIMTFLPNTNAEIFDSVKMGISMTVSDMATLEEILKNSTKIGVIPKIHLKINSGMNRFGIDKKSEFEKILNFCFGNKVKIMGVYTHLASSDFNYCKKQCDNFGKIFGALKLPTHITLNDYTIFNRGGEFDGVRSGIDLLGGVENLLLTKQCFEVQSEILEIRELQAGEFVGYNFGYQCKEKTTFAVVGMGYADISMRNLSNCGKVLVNGKKCDIIGYICMDVMFVDVTNCKCKKGDVVTVIGFDKVNSIKTVSKLLNTIPYEVMTSISNRVKRLEK